MPTFIARPIGRVQSSLTDLDSAPRQPDEGAPEAWLVLDTAVSDGLRGIQVGDQILVVTWLDRADRDTLLVRPRGDLNRAYEGVFNTRSPSRPNPIGLHQVIVTGIEGARVKVGSLEAVDGTPILDIKPVLAADVAGR